MASLLMPRSACRANAVLEQEAPWAALKKGNEAQKAHAGRVLVTALESARIAAVLMAPVVPGLAERVLQQLACAPPRAVRACRAAPNQGCTGDERCMGALTSLLVGMVHGLLLDCQSCMAAQLRPEDRQDAL